MDQSLSVKIHPLVISSACDHYTRVSLGGSRLSPNSLVAGLVFGLKRTDEVVICDNTEVLTEIVNGEDRMLAADIEKKTRLWTTVYNQYQLIGWYSFASHVTNQHISLQRSLMHVLPNPIFILFDNSLRANSFDSIPITIFSDIISSSQAISFKIDSPEVEKIAVDEILNSLPVKGVNALDQQHYSTLSSLSVLESKIDIMMQEIQSMKDGSKPVDPSKLRLAMAVCQSRNRLSNNSEIQAEITKDITDSLFAIYLASATKSCANIHELGQLYALMYSSRDRPAKVHSH